MAASATGLSSSAWPIAMPRAVISLRDKRRSILLSVLTLRTPLAGYSATTCNRAACSKIVCSMPTVRPATPAPPVVRPPRPDRGLAVLPATTSAWKRSMSRRSDCGPCDHPLADGHACRSGCGIDAKVFVAIGRRRQPRSSPLSAFSRYQSQTSATVRAVRVVRFSSTGSAPWATPLSFVLTRLRASSGVNSATEPSVRRFAPPFRVPVLNDERAGAARLEPNPKASQLVVPGHDILFRIRLPSLRGGVWLRKFNVICQSTLLGAQASTSGLVILAIACPLCLPESHYSTWVSAG